MGILEAIQEEVKKYAREYLMHEDAKKVMIDHVNKLYQKGFTVERICDLFDLSLGFVEDAIKQTKS
jgi:hypothetical protein